MSRLKEWIQRHKLIAAVLLFCFSLRLYLYRPQAVGWDESTYILIGKYLFSEGQIGLLEPFRPPVWPFLLGLSWKLGLDPIISGRVLTILFSLGILTLVYGIGRKVYSTSVGTFAAFLLGISPSFFFWGNGILTEIPSTFLGLLSVYWALNGRYLLSGLAGMTAFFTKFTQSLTLAAVGAFVLRQSGRPMNWRPVRDYVLGCVVVFGAGMFCFRALYGDAFLPFTQSQLIYTQTPYNWFQGILFVLKVLPRIEGWLLVFALVNLFLLFRNRTAEKIVLLGIGLLQLAWIGKLPSEVSRFLLTALPYLYLLTANGIVQSFEFSRSKGFKSFLAACVLILAGTQCYMTVTTPFAADQLTVFQRYIRDHEASIKGAIWISSPTMLAYSGLKADEIMYYPVFNIKKISELSSKFRQADFIFVDSADLRCGRTDLACRNEKNKLLNAIKQGFQEVYYKEPSSGRILAIYRAEK